MNKVRDFLLKHKRWSSAGAMALAVALMLGVVNSPAVVGASAAKRELPIYCVARDDKCVSLTFDAAWGNEDTGELIAILDKYGVKATFFLVGQWVDKYPESVGQLFDAGMEIGSHSDDHAHFSRLSAEEITSNVSSSCDKIERVTGTRPTLFRCPYGEYDDNVISTVNAMGINTIQWDVDSLDWKGLSASEITKRVTEKVGPGSIILFHNAAENTPEALPSIIEYLLANGYAIVPIGQLLLSGGYTIDNTGRMCPEK